MASHESLPEAALGRSSSMDARDTLGRSDSQRKTNARRSNRAGNDLFVCFAARTSLNLVSRPVLSPSRDKGKDIGRRGRALSSSIFSKAAKKQGFEVEEPTSPKVTCIGQVRVRHKKKSKPRTSGLQDADALRKGRQRRLESSSESSSLGRTDANAASASKEQNSSSSACSGFGKDFSCFTLPCDSYGSLPSFRGNKKGCGAVFAKSLVLIQETDGKRDSKANTEQQSAAQICGSFELHGDEQKSIPGPQETQNSPAPDVHFEEEDQVVPQIPPEFATEEATISILDDNSIQRREDAISETEEQETDTFEPEPPPPNALLLMRLKSNRLRVVTPPPSVDIVLKRSTSAPAHCRVSRSTTGYDEDCETDLESGKENVHLEEKLSKERISEEDLPKRISLSCAQKYFLKRCKSVSQSLTRSNGLQAFVFPQHTAAPAEKETPVAAFQDVNRVEKASQVEKASSESISLEVDQQGTVPESLLSTSRKRSESESLKISLDVVPETWLWETCTVVRPHKESLTQEQERRRGTKWLDAELEASVWKSCKVTDSLNRATESISEEAELPDTEVEATLQRSCRASQDSSQEDIGKVCESMESGTGVEGMIGEVFLRRRSTEVEDEVKEQQHEDQGSLEEYCDSSSQAMEVEGNDSEELPRVTQCEVEIRSICIAQDADEDAEKLTCRDNHQTSHTAPKVEDQQALREKSRAERLDFLSDGEETSQTQQLEIADCYTDEEETWKEQQVERLNSCSDDEQQQQQQQEKLLHELKAEQNSQQPLAPAALPSPASITSPFQAPATTDTLLFLRYNVGALRISLDGSDLNQDAEKSKESGEQQHKVMLKAISHFHEVGTCARLLKAASGRESGSLSSALRLQRCKSEPVRLTS